MLLSDGKDTDSKSFYPTSNTGSKNEISSTSLEALLTGSGEVTKTTDPSFYTNSQTTLRGELRKGLTSPGLVRQNSNQNAQNQHSGESGEHNPSSVGSSRGSTSFSPNYSDCDTPRENNFKSCDSHPYSLSAMLSSNVSSGATKTAASFPTTQMVYSNNVSVQQRDIKLEKMENSSLRSLLDGKNRIENSIVNSDIPIKSERNLNLKLTLKRAPRVIESSPSHVSDVSLPKSKSTGMFDFQSDDDEPFDFKERRNMTVSVIAQSPTRLQIKPKMANIYDSNSGKLEKYKKNELKHSSSVGDGKRKRKLDSKKEKKKRKTGDRGSESMGEAAVYTTSTMETEVKSDNLKVKFIKSGSKVSMESSPKTSSPSSTKDRDKSDRKSSKEHSDKYEVSSVKSKSSSSSSQKSLSSSSSHRHRSISSPSVTVSKADSKLITKTPTIKLKPITMPHSSSVNVPSVKTPTTSSTSSSKNSLTPTSATIGRIGAVSLATSGSSKSGSMTPPPSGKSSSSTSVKTPPIGKGPTAASIYSSKSQTSSSTSGKSSTGSSNRNLATTGRNSTGSLSKGSNGLPSSGNKMYSTERKGGSPSLSGGRNTPNSSVKSSSSLTKSSTSSSKPQSGSSTNAANVLSFLNTNASGIASLPPIPKRSSSSSSSNKSTSTPLSAANPPSSTVSSTSSYSSPVNATAAMKSSSAINSTSTSTSVSKPNNISGYGSGGPNKGSGTTTFTATSKSGNPISKSNNAPLPSQHTVNKSVSNNATPPPTSNVSRSSNNTAVSNSNRPLPVVGTTSDTANKSSTKSGITTPPTNSNNINNHSVNSKIISPTTMTHSSKISHTTVNSTEREPVRKPSLVSTPPTSVSSSSVTTNVTSIVSSTASSGVTTSSPVSTTVTSTVAVTVPSVSGGNGSTPATHTSPSSSAGGSTTCTLSASAMAKARARKSSLSAVIDKLTKSSQQNVHVSSVPEGSEGSPGAEERGFDDAFEAETELQEGCGTSTVKKVVNAQPGEAGKAVNNKTGQGRGRPDTTDNKSVSQKSPGNKGCVDSPSKKGGGGESGKSSAPRDGRSDSRNLFSSIMDSLSYEEQTSKGDKVVSESDNKSVSNSKNNSSSQGLNVGSNEREGGSVSRDADHPSPAKKARTQSPKTNPNKFNGETSSPRDVDKKCDSEKDFFKVPTPKSNSVEDSEDTENLVVRRKSRTSTTRPVLSPASPASSPENLIIDCQTMSPRTLQNKTNSPQCNTDIADTVIENNRRINSSIKTSKTHTASPKIKGTPPTNSPITVVAKEHSNPSSVSNPSPCDIDDDLMNEAIMGFNS